MALNFHPLVIIDVLVGVQNPEIWTWCFFQHWENFFWVPPVPEGLVGWCQPCAITTAPKNLLSIFLVNRAKDWAVDATAKADWERGHVKPHQWFLSPPFFFLSSLFSFVILEFIFLIFFDSKALFIYLMYTAKLGEKGAVTWDYFFFFDLWYVNCSVYTSGITAWYKAVPA